jgi:hypothetical protein
MKMSDVLLAIIGVGGAFWLGHIRGYRKALLLVAEAINEAVDEVESDFVHDQRAAAREGRQ